MNIRFLTLSIPVIISLVAGCFPLYCPGEVPTNSPSFSLPDIQTPGVKELIDSAIAPLEEIDKERKNALTALLNRHLGVVTEMLAERKKTRNTGGIAVATAGITIFESALTNLATYGKFSFPEKVRRELESSVSQCKSEAATIAANASNKRTTILAPTLEKLMTIASAMTPAMSADAKPALESRLNEMLDAVMSAKSAPTPTALATPSATPVSNTDTNKPAESTTNLPPILASSGEADQWATVASWQSAMMGMDIISIPVADSPVGTNSSRQFNPISGQDSELIYIVHQKLAMQDGMLFRLKRINGTNGVDVVEWPKRENGFHLVVRAKSTGLFPSYHAFDLQVSLPGGDLSKVVRGATLEGSTFVNKPPPSVVLTIITIPEGASVYVDRILQKQVNTPCRIPISKGNHSLGLALPGYEPLSVTNYSFTTNRTLRWTFQPDPRIQKKSITVSANAASWTPADITVNKGDTVIIRADGQWSCAPGKEPCDATGYPNNAAFYRYYMDSASYPRRTATAGYGALVMRIGNDAKLQPVNKSLRLVAPETGPLFFDVNEGDEGKHRTDNTGAIVVNLTIMPSQPLLPTH